MPVRVDPSLRPGLTFMTLHFQDDVATNLLTIDATDPKSGTAEFKATAIRIETAARPRLTRGSTARHAFGRPSEGDAQPADRPAPGLGPAWAPLRNGLRGGRRLRRTCGGRGRRVGPAGKGGDGRSA